MATAASTADRGALERGEELVGAGLDLVAARPGDGTTLDRAHLVEQLAVALAEPMDQRGGALDVGHEHRDEPRGQRALAGPPAAEGAFGLQLAGDEPDRHDLVLLGRLQQPGPGPVPGRLVLERDLAEAGQRVADVGGVVDRQPSPSTRVDVGERPVGQAGALRRTEAGHGEDPNGCL